MLKNNLFFFLRIPVLIQQRTGFLTSKIQRSGATKKTCEDTATRRSESRASAAPGAAAAARLGLRAPRSRRLRSEVNNFEK